MWRGKQFFEECDVEKASNSSLRLSLSFHLGNAPGGLRRYFAAFRGGGPGARRRETAEPTAYMTVGDPAKLATIQSWQLWTLAARDWWPTTVQP